ncbi:MAG TPA: hypothetical protein PLS25_08715, partial [Methanoregulaceae archaeon]|nr:hypothetical protein [Methanoregulaceae archaeon]
THGHDGYLFRPGDERDLAVYILKALSGEISAPMLLQKKESLKERVSWSIVADRYVRSYNRLTERHPGRDG